MLTGFLLEHESGVRLLAAPVHPEEAEIVTSATVGKIISLLRDLFDYVVIDTPAYLNDVVITALEQSDEIYAVTTMDLPSVKNVRIMLQKLRQLGTDMDRARLVLNRADSKVGLQMSDVASALEREIVAKVPSDRLVPLSVNRGNPVVLDAPRSAVAKSLIALSQLASQRDEGVHAGVA
jgi:pilus assembly protein CpaE